MKMNWNLVLGTVGLLPFLGASGVGWSVSSVEQEAKQQMCRLHKGLRLYEIQTGEFPSPADGLQQLTRTTADGRRIISVLGEDPWGNPYFYDLDNNVPVIVSAGPDGKLGTVDDILGEYTLGCTGLATRGCVGN